MLDTVALGSPTTTGGSSVDNEFLVVFTLGFTAEYLNGTELPAVFDFLRLDVLRESVLVDCGAPEEEEESVLVGSETSGATTS